MPLPCCINVEHLRSRLPPRLGAGQQRYTLHSHRFHRSTIYEFQRRSQLPIRIHFFLDLQSPCGLCILLITDSYRRKTRVCVAVQGKGVSECDHFLANSSGFFLMQYAPKYVLVFVVYYFFLNIEIEFLKSLEWWNHNFFLSFIKFMKNFRLHEILNTVKRHFMKRMKKDEK